MRVIELCKFALWLWNWFSSYATLKLLRCTLYFNYIKMAWYFWQCRNFLFKFVKKPQFLSWSAKLFRGVLFVYILCGKKIKTTSSRAVKFPQRQAYLTIPLKSEFNWDAAIFWVAFCLESVPCFYDYPVAAARASASGGGGGSGPCKIIAHSIHVLLCESPFGSRLCARPAPPHRFSVHTPSSSSSAAQPRPSSSSYCVLTTYKGPTNNTPR